MPLILHTHILWTSGCFESRVRRHYFFLGSSRSPGKPETKTFNASQCNTRRSIMIYKELGCASCFRLRQRNYQKTKKELRLINSKWEYGHVSSRLYTGTDCHRFVLDWIIVHSILWINKQNNEYVQISYDDDECRTL